MTQNIYVELQQLVEYFSQLDGMENVNPVILMNKITQHMIDTRGAESCETIKDAAPREIICNMVTETIDDTTDTADIAHEIVENEDDLVILGEYFSKKQLAILSLDSRFELVMKSLNALVLKDPSFQLVLYLWPENMTKFERVLVGNFNKIAPPLTASTK